VPDLPQTAPELQLAVDAGLVTWPEIEAILRELGLSREAIERWRAGSQTVSEVVIEEAGREP
jgi:hypothetical protein